jgi:hypothetical protein
VQAEIEERRRKEIARKAKVVARASYSTTFVDPFDLLGMNVSAPRGWDAGKHLSEKQISLLKKQGVDPSSMPYAQASQLIRVLFQRWNNKLSTMKQIKLLKKRGIDAVNMPYADASKQISLIAEKEGWKNRN